MKLKTGLMVLGLVFGAPAWAADAPAATPAHASDTPAPRSPDSATSAAQEAQDATRKAERAAERDDAETIKTALQRAAERLKRLSFEITGNDYALTEQSPEEVSASLQAYRENVLADRSGPQPIPEHAKLPIDRPCSACSDGDTEMKYHDHTPPFRAQPVPEVKPPNSD